MFDETFRATLSDLFRWRRDVRRFRITPLPPGMLDEVIGCAAYAPSVGYSEPWRFVRVASASRRLEVVAEFERANAAALASYEGERSSLYATLKLAGLREAPEHLAVFADAETTQGGGLGRATMPEMLAYSVVCAIHTVWLAARARGIGVGWVSILDPATIARILEVPSSWQLIGYLCIGYPEEEHLDRELVRAGWETATHTRVAIVER